MTTPRNSDLARLRRDLERDLARIDRLPDGSYPALAVRSGYAITVIDTAIARLSRMERAALGRPLEMACADISEAAE